MLIVASSLAGAFLLVASVAYALNYLDTPAVMHAKIQNGESKVWSFLP